MAVRIDPSNDWKLLERPETVAYYVKTGETYSGSGIIIPNTQRDALLKEFVAADAQLAKSGLTWYMWRNQIPFGQLLKPNDRFSDCDGVMYLVWKAELVALRTAWRLIVTQVQVAKT